MCIICIEDQKGKLQPLEGLRNLREMKSTLEEEHYYDVYCKLYDDFLEQEQDEYCESIGFGD